MLPSELLATPQWLVSGEDKAPRSPKTGHVVDFRDSSHHVSYEEAKAFAERYGMDVGFVLTTDDPFVVIDLDAPTTQEQANRHKKIYDAFSTYAELSRSGNGIHIWCRGQLPHGARRDKVEVYPHSRYMICTGRTIRDEPINDCQSTLIILYREISSAGHDTIDLTDDSDPTLTDAEVFEMGMRAVNRDKFDRLCRGQWEGEYPSQSEADYALINMLAYYTTNNAQVKRIFRYTKLGKRDKAQREKYLDMMIAKVRAEQPPPIDFRAVLAKPVVAGEAVPQLPAIPAPKPEIPPAQVPTSQRKNQAVNGLVGEISLPPGLVGEIARYIYDSSTRPVLEVSVAAALSLCAGVLGRQFNISGTGLNLYVILLAKTGVGKEGGAAGIERLIRATRITAPVVDGFLGPGTFASGQGMLRTLDKQPSFVSILGEFGLMLQDLSDPTGNKLERFMRRAMLDLYSKSGKSGVVYPSAYSDSDKNTKLLYSPAVTLMGESTPETFYAGLSPQHIADGLIPRFLIIEYLGDRPPRNRVAFDDPPPALVQRFADIVEIALRMQHNRSWQDVTMDAAATKMMADFDKYCDAHIRGGGNEGIRELWNRAHLKALRVAGVLTAAERPHAPEMTEVEARWAIDLVVRDSTALASRFEAGDVGEGESKQQADLERVIADYLDREVGELEKYGVTDEMKRVRVIPYVYFWRRCANLSAFRKDRRGTKRALREGLQDMVRQGLLVEVPKAQAYDEFGSRGELFHVPV